MARRFSWLSIALLCPVFGWIALVPLLIVFPIYPDELQWKIISSRLLLDSGKLLYLFPECSKGILLDSPVSWYPAQLANAFIYSDMTNPQMLRYWGIAVFVAMIALSAWIVKKTLRPETGYLATAGALIAPLSLGVMPFLLVMNRPEQGLVLMLLIGCATPLLVGTRALTALQVWAIALLFVLLSWMMVGTHIKGIFLLPALLLAAALTIRQWAPTLAVTVAAAFGAVETFRLWALRTDCPESPFLTQVFHAQALSPDSLKSGLVYFLELVARNILGAKDYWRGVSLRQEYQSGWLPPSETPRTLIETVLNAAIPVAMAIAIIIIIYAFASAILRARNNRTFPSHGPLIAMSLLACVLGIAGFQSGKNFYEPALIFPTLGIAVMLALPETPLPGARKLLFALAALAVANQIAIAFRFYGDLPLWRNDLQARQPQQVALKKLIDRCGIEINATTRHLLVDNVTYTVLWPTQEPYLFDYATGWWATGIDEADIIRDRKITGAVARCGLVSGGHWSSVVSQGGFCCAKS